MSRGFSIPFLKVRVSLELLAYVAIAIAIVLRIIYLGSREFWYDEVVSLNISAGQLNTFKGGGPVPIPLEEYTAVLNLPEESTIRDTLQTLVKLLKSLLGGEPHPLLFFMTQHFWLRLFGNSEVATRSTGMLISCGAIFCAYGLGRAVLGNRGGLILAALLGLNPFYFSHSLNLRMYAPIVFWAALSAWALMHFLNQQDTETPPKSRSRILWNVLLIGSVAAGFLTVYLFAYWLVALGLLVLLLDRRRWWQHGLRLGAGVGLTIPWVLWGMTRQLRNADIERFSGKGGFLEAVSQHFQDITQILGIHLLVGDWATSIPSFTIVIAGVIIAVLLGAISYQLWQQGERRVLCVALVLGVFPLALAAAVDIFTNKFTLGFGMGRSIIFMLPGSLLLVTAWLELSADRLRGYAATALMLLYLTITVGDFSLRQRLGTHVVANIIEQDLNTPTLIAMSSRARGHVFRLAYYINPAASVFLLAQPAPKLIPVLTNEAPLYPRVIWLDSVKPSFFDPPATEQEKQQIQQILLNSQLQLVESQKLRGTMPLDEFVMSVYIRRPS